jgi:AAA+ superfamily predicted ATPase
LVLPAEEKNLLLALANSYSKDTNTFVDFVIGKGKSMITLLDGPPGVGKTLTAESIAEAMKAPLYKISAGELGVMPSTMKKKLSEVLDIATKWNAIVLINEADIFLEERRIGDLYKNELVSSKLLF